MSDMPLFEKYPFNVDLLTEEEGGGYTITFPDLPECMSDGETVEEAISHGLEACHDWMDSMIEDQKPFSAPNGSTRAG